jgi:hypothetical protein
MVTNSCYHNKLNSYGGTSRFMKHLKKPSDKCGSFTNQRLQRWQKNGAMRNRYSHSVGYILYNKTSGVSWKLRRDWDCDRDWKQTACPAGKDWVRTTTSTRLKPTAPTALPELPTANCKTTIKNTWQKINIKVSTTYHIFLCFTPYKTNTC